jgi:hypothetical protein
VSKKSHVWDRKPGEPTEWYGRFLIFLEIGEKRSMLATYRLWKEEQDKKIPRNPKNRRHSKILSVPPSWEKACIEWQWWERSAPWDDEQLRLKIEETKRLREDAYRLRLRRAEQHIEDEWRLRNSIVKLAEDMLQFPLQKRELAPDGQTVIISPARWSMKDALAAVKLASDLGRVATGLKDDMEESLALEAIARAGMLDEETLVAIAEKSETYRQDVRGMISSKKVQDEDEEDALDEYPEERIITQEPETS